MRSPTADPRSSPPWPSTERLLRRFALERRPSDLEELVRRHLPLARGIARRFHASSVARDDLEQAAYLGLVKAIHRFEPERGYAFSTFAVPTMLGEVRRQCREAMWPAHVPRPMQERIRATRRARDTLTAALGRSPTADDLAAHLGWEHELVVETAAAANTLNSVSLDAGRRGIGDDGEETGLSDALGAEDDAYELVEYRAAIEQALPRLDDTERSVLRLRYAEEHTFAQIGRELSVAPAQAASLLRGSLDRLARLTAEADHPALAA
jgi:RNA polymerase sigma-B factor